MKEQKVLELRSEKESFRQIESLIQEVCDNNNLNDSYLSCISVALSEAFDNAMVHGNGNNPDKKITVEFEKTAAGVNFAIEDEGKGFDSGIFPGIKDDGKEKHYPGRGLFLIHSMVDDVKFVNSGSRIELGFKTAGINIETSIDRVEKMKTYTQVS